MTKLYFVSCPSYPGNQQSTFFCFLPTLFPSPFPRRSCGPMTLLSETFWCFPEKRDSWPGLLFKLGQAMSLSGEEVEQG